MSTDSTGVPESCAASEIASEVVLLRNEASERMQADEAIGTQSIAIRRRGRLMYGVVSFMFAGKEVYADQDNLARNLPVIKKGRMKHATGRCVEEKDVNQVVAWEHSRV